MPLAWCTGHFNVPLSIFCPTCGPPNHCSKCVDAGKCDIVTPLKAHSQVTITYQNTETAKDVPIDETKRWQEMSMDDRKHAMESSNRPQPIRIFCSTCDREKTTLSKDLICPNCHNRARKIDSYKNES